MAKQTCGQCANAQFRLTPTGRIRKMEPGRCAIAKETVERLNSIKHPPCVVPARFTTHAIWPEYDATYCLSFNPKEAKKP